MIIRIEFLFYLLSPYVNGIIVFYFFKRIVIHLGGVLGSLTGLLYRQTLATPSSDGRYYLGRLRAINDRVWAAPYFQ